MGVQQTATQRNATRRNATHGNGAVEEAGGRRGEGRSGWAGLGWLETRSGGLQGSSNHAGARSKPSRHAQHARMAKAWVARFPALLPLLQPGCGVRWAPARQACGWAWRRLPYSATTCAFLNKTQHSWALLTAHSPPRRYLKKKAAYLHLHNSQPLSDQKTLPELLQGGCDVCWTGRGLRRDWLEGGQGRAGQGRHRVPRGTLFRAAGGGDGADSGTNVGK
ncbi:hypothetical protein MAPG_07774 [Magnaporthiopsis poae ATCC 64411]|uniref:Uncharacterized protein n=1 Tax=Magnaporthiopsis poae (strain ATCC 64411 / 73-15) TaxID=644358 RepID=A0A0C4E5K2_MAGP6|nr:hypothetical protein MAPG_07774 [Magnaporthiopsis poae ATCC 64411]